MKNILVLGGCGFVGRAFTRRLLADGHNVMVIDNLSSGIHPENWLDIPEPVGFGFMAMDCRQYFQAPRHVVEYDTIIHCAAVVGGRTKIEGDPIAVAADLSIDSEFFQWAVRAKHKPKIIYFSSSAVYPIDLQTEQSHCALSETLVNFNSNRIGMPDQTYGFAKLAGEFLAKHATEKYGLDVVIYRPFSGYGEDQSFDYPFPSIIRRIVRKENPIEVWGSGQQVRDFIHIDDIVDAVLATKDKLAPGEVLNLGSGEPISFADLIWRASSLLEHQTSMKPLVGKPTGVFHRVADTWKLDQLYQLRVPLDEGIKRVAAHIREADK